MPTRPLVIIHGWSDDSRSFEHLVQLLRPYDDREPRLINLADYISMDDNITYDDLAAALDWAWEREGLPDSPWSVDAIVHSTGSLVIRYWLTEYYTPTTAPIKHLVMLAPANFGSALAHKGRAFMGRIARGFNSKKTFQVGEKLLKGLELASPFTWDLAMEDRFNKMSFYGPGKILCTVLVGDTGYTGIAAAANEEDADGTVRIASANMNCAFIDADFSEDPAKPQYTYRDSNGLIAFAISPGENHQTIIGQAGGPRQTGSIEIVSEGLSVSDAEFPDWCQQLISEEKAEPTPYAYQNIVVYVRDQFAAHVHDYFIEFYQAKAEQHSFAQFFHEHVVKTIHAYGDDPSFRSLYMDCHQFYANLEKNHAEIQMSLTALPQLGEHGNVVGYRSFAEDHLGAITIAKHHIEKVFAPHRTLLIRVTLKREQADEVFALRSVNR